ncbi:hypothetical protein [Candidatus Spongiihabitans sp.]|uniref:hypothetical protein n=1 Tax=Candidatus Spongiihabitans sp. TaxID=3101308 RepID=UPI003C7C102A
MLVGENHNPSILNPDFLWRNRIVPENLELDDNIASMSSPIKSQCAFKNGMKIISEANRIVFSQDNPEENNFCHEIAQKYLKTVPLVRYTAIGINFVGSFPVSNGNQALRNMLRSGEWDKFEDTVSLPEISLTYSLADRNVTLIISAIDKKNTSKSEGEVLVRGNFHRDIQAEQGESHRVAITMVDDWESDLKCYKELIQTIARGTKNQ